MSAPRVSSRSQEVDCGGHSWGFIAANVDDPPECISKCRERFLKGLLPKDETFERVCEVLSDKDHMDKEQPFRALYCCDAQLCGVDNLGRSGKDPNVNWFINACQDIGYHSILDPGPPDTTYTCGLDAVYEDDPRCQGDKTMATTSAHSSTASSEKLVVAKFTPEFTTFTTSPTLSTRRDSMPSQTNSMISDAPLATSQGSSNADGDQDDGYGLSTAAKVAISICTVLGLVAILALVLCFLRRKSQKNRANVRRRIRHQTASRPLESPTPLVSPTISHTDTDGVPLTPPARLRERKFLPTGMSRASVPGEKGGQYPGFPTSPLFSPTTNKLIPRHERTPKMYGGSSSPPLSRIPLRPTRPLEPDHAEQINPFETSSAASISADSRLGSTMYTNGSPTRPPRPHGPSIEITNLVSPGPPPNRALPSTPPNGSLTPSPLSPTMPSPALTRSSDIPLSPNIVSRSPPRSASLPHTSRDLYALTEEDARDSYNSWGSWSAKGAGRVSTTLSSPGMRQGSPVVEKTDLGGRY